MVDGIKNISLSYAKNNFDMLYAKKVRLAQKLKLSLSWEEFFLHLAMKTK